VGSIGAEEGRGGVLHGEQGAAAAMAYGGATGTRAGARLGSRRSGAGAGRGEAAWNAKNPMVTRGGGRVTGDEEGLRQEFDGG
jgi:hypothetical protein